MSSKIDLLCKIYKNLILKKLKANEFLKYIKSTFETNWKICVHLLFGWKMDEIDM